MPTKHLPYGGSTMERTLNCQAWRQKADALPPQGSSSFADEGTMLHDCMELIFIDDNEITLNSILSNKKAIKETQCGDAVLTPELWEAKLIPAHDAVTTLFKLYKVEYWFCEPFVELIEDEAGGSIDMVAFGTCPDTGKKVVLIIDYKFGYVSVAAKENSQMLFYALCCAVDPEFEEEFEDVERIVTAIIQPNDVGDTLDKFAYDIERLDAFEAAVYEAIDNSKLPNPTPTAGDWCKYCPAATTCEAKTGAADKALRLNPDDASILADAMGMVDQLEEWCREVRKHAQEQLEMGVTLKGWKLVDKRATRKWRDAAAAEAAIKKNRKLKQSETHKTTLLTPPQFEKLCKKKGVDFEKYADYIEAVSSGTTIAHDSDPRPSALPVEALRRLKERL